YFYIDSTPTHSYMKALYKYPQRAFPYRQLVDENGRRTRRDREFELLDTGIFSESRYFDVQIEYAKVSPNDILIRLRIDNRGPEPWPLHVLPSIWFRNGWSWGRKGEGYWPKPSMRLLDPRHIACEHQSLGRFTLEAISPPDRFLFTENETNFERLFGSPNASPYVKDAFHRYVVNGDRSAVNPDHTGTKAAAYYRTTLPAGGGMEWRFRLSGKGEGLNIDFDGVFRERILEADLFYGFEGAAPIQLRIAREASSNGSRATLPSLPRPRNAGTAATASGFTFTTATCSPCRTTGNFPGTPRGITRSTWLPLPRSTRITRKNSLCSCCASGTCTPTGRSRPTNLLSMT
ncbi:MAG TPA: hypothetical protein VHB50_17520, partial [Bryobacteraceae bacterium]|nr:hypothetical protein [Bryobacteraceae bacterium]